MPEEVEIGTYLQHVIWSFDLVVSGTTPGIPSSPGSYRDNQDR